MVAGLVGSTGWPTSRSAAPGWRPCCPCRDDRGLLAEPILLGVRHPESLVVQGVGLHRRSPWAWLAIRARRASAAGARRQPTSYVRGVGRRRHARPRRRSSPIPRERALRPRRLGARGAARNWVEPPFDIGRYPSPLAGFRKTSTCQGRAEPGQRLRQGRCSTSTGVPGRDPGSGSPPWTATTGWSGVRPRRAARPGRRLLPARVLHHRQPGRGQGGRRVTVTLGEGWMAGCGCPPSAPSGPWTSRPVTHAPRPR